MDRSPWVSALVILLHLTLYISGETRPRNVIVHIWEGNVTITWEPPQENAGDYRYQVQLSHYADSPTVWENVTHCNLLNATICNIGYLSVDSNFKVKVGALTTQNSISWSVKRHINIRHSQLFAPTFSLSSTSYTVRVKIHRKQILDEIFSNGVRYTTYLWQDGQENQTVTKSDDDIDDDGEMTFISLQSLQVYCVFVKVESIATDASNSSSVHCIRLPIGVSLIICIILLGLLGIMAFLMLFICFLRRPRKMPSALKLVVNAGKPLIIKSDQVETVTDNGWIVITNNSDTKKSIEFTEEDKGRRGSLDSGVSIEQLHLTVSNAKTEKQNGDLQVDSGCGSLKGTEVSGSVGRVTRQFSMNEIHRSGENGGSEDSGLGLGPHEASGSLEGEDTGLLSEVVVGDGYRSQSPSSVDVQNDMDSNMAAPSAGYRSGQVTCTCADHEYCIWCKFKNPFTEDCPPVTQSQTDFRQTDVGNSVSSSYLKKTFMQTVNLLNMEVSTTETALSDNDCTESSLLILSCPLLLQNEKKQDGIMHTRSFALDNIELTFS
ncbi:interleukin-10 receptor subunit alpha [Ictalurus punctatus]|uniref:Interleukin-10 receptor subunit alpha n=1 Tax=Ictalurus punctatus TaxID=7998 RepID=A0A2D0SWS3_ICTPU|nr:interleukin-10 receptor subunit alpha [Ictalurus punctatus]